MPSSQMIETRRLFLRRLMEQDRIAIQRMDWLDGRRVIRRSLASEYPFGFMAVVLKQGSIICGICGLLPQRLDHGTEIEVAYHLLPEFRGRGIATEASRTLIDYAFSQLDQGRVVSLIVPDNLASRRVAEKNGLRHERDLMFQGTVHGMHVIENGRYGVST